MNIATCISTNRLRNPDAIAVRSEDGSLSYAELDSRIEKVADFLAARSVHQGDIVAVSLARESSILVACFACARIGAAIYCVPKHYPDLQKRAMLKAAGADWMLVDSVERVGNIGSTESIESAESVESAKSGERIGDNGGLESEDPSLPELIHFQLEAVNSSPARPVRQHEDLSDSLALIVMGSGSTGKPKLMPFSHRLLVKRVERNNKSVSLSKRDCLTSDVHLNFYSAFIRALGILMLGGTFAIIKKNKPLIPETLSALGVTFLQTTVFHIHTRCKLLPAQGECFYGFLNGLSIHSSAVSNELRRQVVSQMTKNVFIVYGTNESGTIAVAAPEELFTPPGTVGTLIEDVQLEIVDENNTIQAPGAKGEARVRTSCCIDGYLHDPEANARVFKDGWFYPGDVLQVTPSSRIVHFGRADSVMIVNGINIYPGEIESVVSSHPNVQDCVALPITHPVHGDVPVCAVTLVNSEEFNEDELSGYVLQRLGARSPSKIIPVDSISRNDRGKIDRDELRQKILTLFQPRKIPLR